MQLDNSTKWVIRADKPFSGSVQSVLTAAGKVAYTKGLTVEEYSAECGYPLRVISDAELDGLLASYIDGLVTEPSEITDEKFDYALNVLPPCRWKRVDGVEMFYVSELLQADLASWYAKAGGKFFTFNDRAGRPAAEIVAKVRAALNKGA